VDVIRILAGIHAAGGRGCRYAWPRRRAFGFASARWNQR
jgi:hypothetical protein